MNGKETEILRRLAAGLDPVSGRALPAESPYRRAEVVSAVEQALALLEASARAPRRGPAAPGAARSGTPWTEDEIDALYVRFRAGESHETIARALERTPAAVIARLVQLDLMEPPPGFRLRYPPKAAGP